MFAFFQRTKFIGKLWPQVPFRSVPSTQSISVPCIRLHRRVYTGDFIGIVQLLERVRLTNYLAKMLVLVRRPNIPDSSFTSYDTGTLEVLPSLWHKLIKLTQTRAARNSESSETLVDGLYKFIMSGTTADSVRGTQWDAVVALFTNATAVAKAHRPVQSL